MEDSSLGQRYDGGGSSRRRAPESISSITSRMTPPATAISSSNGSTASGSTQHLPRSNGRGTPGANLLQERLRERKVESARANGNHNQTWSGDMTGDRAVQSSPAKGYREKEERRPSSSGIGSGKGAGMGVKQMEDQVSTLHKQNFDLKLELYHRRQRQETLEARLEAAERQLEEQSEMQEVNEQLLAELERRDQALDEAVGVIVNLEEKVERMMREREMVASVDATSYTHTEELSSSPDATPRKNVARMPSFLSEQSEGTEALRSLYLPPNHNFSDSTLPKLQEEGSLDGMDSPRLSVLSESSFLSVYGEKTLDLNAESQEPIQKTSEVEKWVEGPVTTTPQKKSPDTLRNKQFLSINDVLESPLQRLEKLKHTLEKHQLPDRSSLAMEKEKRKLRRGFNDKTSFEHQQTLPPTPDTISTSTLRHFKGSNDTLAPIFHNHTAGITPGVTHNNYQSALSMRPRSAGETVTSRREGHGWDTETQDDEMTETGSIGSTSSLFSESHYMKTHPPKRALTPDLFNFSTSGASDWGRDMMFNSSEPEPRLPSHHIRLREARRASAIEQDVRSDGTATTYQNSLNSSTNSRYSELKRSKTPTPIDTSPRPELPDRRSSLSAVAKLRKSNPAHTQSSPIQPTNTITPNTGTTPSKKSRLLPSRLFRRGDNSTQDPQSPSLETSPPKPPSHNTLTTLTRNRSKNQNSRSQNHYSNLEGERATPPPIRRSRTGATPNPLLIHRPGSAMGTSNRPSSAGTGANRKRGTFGYGMDGADDYFGAGTVAGGDIGAEWGVEKKREKRQSVDFTLGALAGGAPADEGEKAGRKWFGGLRRAGN